MLFQPEHITQIRRGEKTVTRRDWERRQVKPGGTYIASPEMFTSHEDADCYITVLDVYEQPLSDLTAEDAAAEGGYTREEFRRVWKDINGGWNPTKTVTVVEFEYAGRTRNGGGQ